jgi:hypothetical protein
MFVSSHSLAAVLLTQVSVFTGDERAGLAGDAGSMR